MRKRIINATAPGPAANTPWLDVEQVAEVEITSEDPSFPIEAALLGQPQGWRAAGPGTQTIRLRFDRPQSIRRLRLVFRVQEEREQEFAITCSSGHDVREIVRQQYHFSPHGSTQEIEDYRVELDGVEMIELTINPDRSGRHAPASLAEFRLA